MSSDGANKRPNRKRKKSFLKNARKYAKKGHYGRGSDLDADTYQYFVRIMEAYREGFDNEDEKLCFVNNVFEQTKDQEINCSRNQVGCRMVEMLLPFANDNVVRNFIEAFSTELRPLCSDRFASHVLEALVSQACKRSLSEKSSDTKYFTDFVIKASKFLLNNLEDYIWDIYGNHVIRTCLKNLAYVQEDKASIKTKPGKTNVEKESIGMETEVPAEYLEVIRDYAERLITWPQFNELCSTEITSGFLQILLTCLKKLDKKLLKKYLTKFLDDIFVSNPEDDAGTIPAPFLSKSVLMLLETALQVASTKKFSQIHLKLFSTHLAKLAKTRNTNFAVQKLFQHCRDKSQFEDMFEEVTDSFEDIIQAGHSGVLVAIARGCKRLGAKQGSFVQSLMKTMHCEPEERQNAFVLCMSRLIPFEENEKRSNEDLQKEKLNLNGTLLLQEMLDFNKPIKLVNSILSLDVNDLKNLFSNSMGSHIVDSYIKSLFVGEKSREKLVRKMNGTYQELASTKFGSRCFDALWGAAHIKAKMYIMEELARKDASWSNSEHGKIIASKVHLTLFKRNKEDWKNSLNKQDDKSETYLAAILK